MPSRDKIFVSYSHKDKKLFEEFKTMLAPAIQNGTVDLWDDQKIPPGAIWKEEIGKALESARVAVLLVSQNFLASHFITKDELQPLLKAAREEGVTIFWIYLSPCLYEQTEIGSYQAAHDVSRPLSLLSKAQRQAVLSEACAKLIRAAREPLSPAKEKPVAKAAAATYKGNAGAVESSTGAGKSIAKNVECCLLLTEALEQADIAGAGGGPTTTLHRRLVLAEKLLNKGRKLLRECKGQFSFELEQALQSLAQQVVPSLISEAGYALPEAGDVDSSQKFTDQLKEVRRSVYFMRQRLEGELRRAAEFTALKESDERWPILGFRDQEDFNSWLYPTTQRLALSTDPMQRDLFERLLTIGSFTPRQLFDEGYRKDIVMDTLNALLKEKWAEWTDLSTLGSGATAKVNDVGKRLLKRLLGLENKD